MTEEKSPVVLQQHDLDMRCGICGLIIGDERAYMIGPSDVKYYHAACYDYGGKGLYD